MTFAHLPQSPYSLDAAPEVVQRRLGEFTCIVHAGAHVREATAHTLEQIAASAAVDGYQDFVFDLTRVGRYEPPPCARWPTSGGACQGSTARSTSPRATPAWSTACTA